MKFTKQTISNYLMGETVVDNMFLSEYMPDAPAEYLKVYFYALMCCENSVACNNDQLAKALDFSLDLIEDAWDYWTSKGLIKRSYINPADASEYDIEFISLRSEMLGRTASQPATPVAISLDDKQLSQLYRDIQAITGRLLEGREPEAITELIAEYKIDPQLIAYGYKYCTDHGRSNKHRYVAAVLKDWRAKDINSVADAEDYLAGIDKHYDAYRRIFKELGFNRNPSEPEKRVMDSWIDDMGFSMDKIMLACEKTTGISNPNLNYLNSVLVGWYAEQNGTSAEKAKDIPAKLETYYAELRAANEEKFARRRQEIFTQIPRLREVSDELKSAAYKISRNLLIGGAQNQIVVNERRRVDALNAEKAHLLAVNGYQADALDAIYTCPDCKDTGFTDDGERCHCYHEYFEKLSNIK